MALNPQETKFALELVSGKSIAQAARDAGYSESTSTDLAHKWLLIGDDRYKEKLDQYIKGLQKEAINDSIASREELLGILTNMSRTDIDDVMALDGFGANPIPFDEMTPSQKSAIKKLEYRKGDGTKIEMYSKLDAIEKLLKVHGAYAPIKTETTAKIEVSDNEDLDNLTLEERKTLLKLRRKANGQGGKKSN